MKQAAIYKITHLASGKLYIGSTILQPPRKRWWHHISDLRKGTHCARRMQNSWNKYGEAAFSFEIIETCAERDRVTREQFYIDGLKPFFNWSRFVVSAALDPRVGKQISKAMLGNQNTKGLKWSDEARANMSRAVKGKPRSEVQRASMLRNLALARERNRVNKPGMNWRRLRAMEQSA